MKTEHELTQLLLVRGRQSSSDLHLALEQRVSLATVKRALARMVEEGKVIADGRGRATVYHLSDAFTLFMPIDLDLYFESEQDQRPIRTQFNTAVLKQLEACTCFTDAEHERIEALHAEFRHRFDRLDTGSRNRELERLAIDLSWKSSQIEGNTYTLLETELLLKERRTAAGRTRDEATMLLNHKAAIDFLVAHPDYLDPLKVSTIEDIHALLVNDLGIERNLRNQRVGISGTNYVPLDNHFQIREALNDLCSVVNHTAYPPAKALIALLLLSYIQPFVDGNKRTARIVSNAVLMQHGYCPLSFRTVDSLFYKKAMLLFYEQNNASAVKTMFIEQFEFAVKTYF